MVHGGRYRYWQGWGFRGLGFMGFRVFGRVMSSVYEPIISSGALCNPSRNSPNPAEPALHLKA